MEQEVVYDWVLNGTEEKLLYAAGIRQFQAKKAFDAGMLLKRIGAVSRSFRDVYLPEDTALYGLDLSGTEIPLYKTLYVAICDTSSYQTEWDDISFDVAMLIDIEKLMQKAEYDALWGWIIERTGYIFTDDREKAVAAGGAFSDFMIGNKTFYIVKL